MKVGDRAGESGRLCWDLFCRFRFAWLPLLAIFDCQQITCCAVFVHGRYLLCARACCLVFFRDFWILDFHNALKPPKHGEQHYSSCPRLLKQSVQWHSATENELADWPRRQQLFCPGQISWQFQKLDKSLKTIYLSRLFQNYFRRTEWYCWTPPINRVQLNYVRRVLDLSYSLGN